jgi:hypothetical protein
MNRGLGSPQDRMTLAQTRMFDLDLDWSNKTVSFAYRRLIEIETKLCHYFFRELFVFDSTMCPPLSKASRATAFMIRNLLEISNS